MHKCLLEAFEPYDSGDSARNLCFWSWRLLILILDLALPENDRSALGWITAGGLALDARLVSSFRRPGAAAQLVWGGMLRQDWLGFTFPMLFMFAAAITALFSMDLPGLGNGANITS